MCHKWRRVYPKRGGVCETFMSNLGRCSLPMSKKPLEFLLLKTRKKKNHITTYTKCSSGTKKTYTKVPESISSGAQYVKLQK
jgi:hypothetical protein